MIFRGGWRGLKHGRMEKFSLRCLDESFKICDHWDELMHELTLWKFKTVSLGMVTVSLGIRRWDTEIFSLKEGGKGGGLLITYNVLSF